MHTASGCVTGTRSHGLQLCNLFFTIGYSVAIIILLFYYYYLTRDLQGPHEQSWDFLIRPCALLFLNRIFFLRRIQVVLASKFRPQGSFAGLVGTPGVAINLSDLQAGALFQSLEIDPHHSLSICAFRERWGGGGSLLLRRESCSAKSLLTRCSRGGIMARLGKHMDLFALVLESRLLFVVTSALHTQTRRRAVVIHGTSGTWWNFSVFVYYDSVSLLHFLSHTYTLSKEARFGDQAMWRTGMSAQCNYDDAWSGGPTSTRRILRKRVYFSFPFVSLSSFISNQQHDSHRAMCITS